MNGIDYIDESRAEDKALAILRRVGNLRLLGDTGTGKSYFVHYLCQKFGWKLYEFSLNTDVNRWDLVCSDILTANGTAATKTAQREGIILMWLKDRANDGQVKLLHLDEFNYAQPNVTTLINQLADFRKSIWIPELQVSMVRSEQHYLVISMNPYEKAGYTGTFQTNIAQLRRFETLVLDYLSPLQEIKLLKRYTDNYNICKRLTNFAGRTRTSYRKGEISLPVTSQNLINYILLLKEGLGEQDIVEICCNMYPEEERSKVRTLFE